MAEKKVELTPEDKSQIEQILEPLNINPTSSEILNPLAKILREKLGHTDPIAFSEEGAEEADNESIDNDEDTDFTGMEEEVSVPPASKIIDDDDIDLDELLKDEPSAGIDKEDETPASDSNFSEPASDMQFDDFAETTPTSFDSNEIPSENIEPFGEQFDSPSDDLGQDSFAALDESDTAEREDNPFADLGEPNITSGEDLFGDLKAEPSVESPSENFGDLGIEDFGETGTTTGDDTFSDFPTESSTDDMFGDIGEKNDLGADYPKSNDDIFSGLESVSESNASPDAETSSDDLFGDLGDISPTDQDSSSGPSMSFDDFGSDLGTSSIENISDNAGEDLFGDDQNTEISSEGSIEDDLSSLADEETSLEQDLTDEDLAAIQQEIIKYPPKLKRTVIDAIVNDRIPKQNQKELIELIKANQKPEDIALFLSPLLGQKVELYDSSGQYSPEGIPIISTKPIYTKEGLLRQRQLIRKTLAAAAATILIFAGLVTGYKYIYKSWQAGGQYELGLIEIRKAGEEKDSEKRKIRFAHAEEFFSKGEKIEPNNLKFLNLYGIYYMKVGEYEKSFEKLFGKVSPDFGSESFDANKKGAWNTRTEVPFISLAKNESWSDLKLPIAGKIVNENDYMKLISGDKVERKILKAGAYIVSRLEKNIHDTTTYINLGRFHSNIANSFTDRNRYKGIDYKNDELAINYYKEVFTDSDDPHNVQATAGIAKIYYNKKEFSKAASYYNKIIEIFPKNEIGHGGILSTYIEMWKRDKNPQFVLNHHRQVRNALGIEEDLPIYILAKLASFYNDLESNEVRIKYNINPEDQVTGMEIEDNVEHLLSLLYSKTEDRDGEEIKGNEYAEGYYQRGRFFLKKNESRRALKQFEFAANYDPAHYLTVLQMAEFYMRVNDMTEASKLLTASKERYETYKIDYGVREEDEALIEGDPGRIYFDMGKIIYLSSVGVTTKDNINEFPGRKIYPERSLDKMTMEDENRRKELHESLIFFNKAEETNLKNESLKRELYFYKGWIEYMHNNWIEALNSWSAIGEEDAYSNPTLLMGKANAYYYTGQLNASLGNYLKVKEDFEDREAIITTPVSEDMNHQEIYHTLVAVYNNIGAVYERKRNTTAALKNYWKSIETTRKLSTVSEISNSNKDMVFKERPKGQEPLLDDWLAPTLDSIRELKNIHAKALQ